MSKKYIYLNRPVTKRELNKELKTTHNEYVRHYDDELWHHMSYMTSTRFEKPVHIGSDDNGNILSYCKKTNLDGIVQEGVLVQPVVCNNNFCGIMYNIER